METEHVGEIELPVVTDLSQISAPIKMETENIFDIQDVFDLCSACVWIVKIKFSTDDEDDSDGSFDDNKGDSDGSIDDNEGDSDGSKNGNCDSDGSKNGNCDSDDSVAEEEGDCSPDDNVDDENKRDYLICLTAFAVSRKGYLLTCGHGDWHANPVWIRAKQLRGDQTYTAQVVACWPSCEMCLLKVDTELDHVATWGTGNVNIGEPVFLFGHPSSLLGTLVVGAASYDCSEDAVFDFTEDRRCRNYRYPGWIKRPYRIMGHIWNADRFQDMVQEERDKFRFEGNYVARLPIIQCSNLVGGDGASGGPIFNMQGNVVGMLVGAMENYQIGVHVTALRQFVEILEPVVEILLTKPKQQGEELQERNSGQDIGADEDPVIPVYNPEYSEQEMDAHQDPLYRG